MVNRTGSPLVVHIDDVARLRKPHPCGSFEWTVVRLGADIGIRCHGCKRKVLLSRREFEKRLKLFVSRGPEFGAMSEESMEDDASRPDASCDATDVLEAAIV